MKISEIKSRFKKKSIFSKMNIDYENEFWYVICSAAYFSRTHEKRMIYRQFIYLVSELLPCSNCPMHHLNKQTAIYILHNVFPLNGEYLTSVEKLMEWVGNFRYLVQGTNEIPELSKNPKNFGRHWWYVIHSCAICETLDKRIIYVNMIKCLVKLIPCDKCSQHAITFVFDLNPVELYANTFEDLFYWSYMFHEYANDNTNVPMDRRLSFEQVCDIYLN